MNRTLKHTLFGWALMSALSSQPAWALSAGLGLVSTIIAWLSALGIGIFTIAVMWVAFKVAFQGGQLKDYGNLLIGGTLFGAAGVIGALLVST